MRKDKLEGGEFWSLCIKDAQTCASKMRKLCVIGIPGFLWQSDEGNICPQSSKLIEPLWPDPG